MQKYAFLITLSFGVCLLASCSSEPSQKPIENTSTYVRKEQQPEFVVPAPYSAMPHAVKRADINRDGYDDAVLTVMGDTKALDTPNAFDTVYVYQYNESLSTFEQKFRTAVYFGSSVDILDADGDEYPEVFVYTDAGGNDAVVSNGVNIVRYRDGVYSPALVLDGGAPEVISVDVVGQPVVVVKVFGDYWPDVLSHAESVNYLDSLVIFRPLSDSIKASIVHMLFQQALADAEQEYAQAKNAYAEQQDDEAAFAVYSAAVRIAKYYNAVGMPDKLPALRTKEWRFWRGIMPEENLNILKQLTSPQASS